MTKNELKTESIRTLEILLKNLKESAFDYDIRDFELLTQRATTMYKEYLFKVNRENPKNNLL